MCHIITIQIISTLLIEPIKKTPLYFIILNILNIILLDQKLNKFISFTMIIISSSILNLLFIHFLYTLWRTNCILCCLDRDKDFKKLFQLSL